MADNVVLLPGGGGDTISADLLVSGAKVQNVKVAFGVTDSMTQVTAAAPLPVTDAAAESSLATIVTNTGQIHSDLIAPLPSGTNVIGKVSIDQTTPGTTNAVQANAGTNLNTSLLALESGGNLASLNTKTPSLGQNTMANAEPVVLASDFVMTAVTGQSAQTATINNILTTTAGSAATDVSNFRSCTVQLVSTASGGAFIFEGSNDNVTFFAAPFYLSGFNPNPLATAANASGGSNLYHLALPFRYFRCRISTTVTGGSLQAFTTYFSNPLSTTTSAVGNSGTSGMNVRTTDAQASVAAADGKANPTAGMWLQAPYYFNGTTWDRQHGNWNTTTGDTGAKVAAGNGATQTNFDSRGAEITVLFNAQSGTFTTMQFQLQTSFDGGTTWKNFGPATTNNTTPSSTDTYMFIVYPANISQAAGVSPANLVLSTTQTIAINSPLPRTWRMTWNIAGSTPSVTITAIYVNYQL